MTLLKARAAESNTEERMASTLHELTKKIKKNQRGSNSRCSDYGACIKPLYYWSELIWMCDLQIYIVNYLRTRRIFYLDVVRV